tara:strand:- start:47 stop:310 length:264 start_codon:yes stop_codon:yes gene_type:complete
MNKSKLYVKEELTILAVIDCIKIKWHILNIHNNTSGIYIYHYFKKIYKQLYNIELDDEGKRYTLKNIVNINNYVIKNPNRICIYIHF